MLLCKEEYKLRAFAQDWIARLLFINAFLVIASYGIAVVTDKASVSFMLYVKTAVLLLSFTFLIVSKRMINPSSVFDTGKVPLIFCFLLILYSLFSNEPYSSLEKTMKFLLPLLYVYYSIAYLIAKFGIKLVLKGIHWGILLIYSIPVISYIILGGSLSDNNIYGYDEDSGQAFVSNHYGWATTLYILSFLFVWNNIKVKTLVKPVLGAILIISIILLLSAANRASWLSVIVLIIPLFFTYRGLKVWHKLLAVILFSSLIVYFLGDPGSSINFAINKSIIQQESGEARFEISKAMVENNNDNPIYWIFGNGLFNYETLDGQTRLHSYHNSYWELLFGAGVPVFLIFLSFMFFRPIFRFIKFYSRYTLLIAPLIIIPFFESNLGGGQFLFFPWFTYLLTLNAKIKFWIL